MYFRSFFKKRILQQLYVEMTEEYYGSKWEIDHCYHVSKTNLSTKEELSKTTQWINLRPMYCRENNPRKAKLITIYICSTKLKQRNF